MLDIGKTSSHKVLPRQATEIPLPRLSVQRREEAEGRKEAEAAAAKSLKLKAQRGLPALTCTA